MSVVISYKLTVNFTQERGMKTQKGQ